MTKITSPDNWVEIPPGEFLTGLAQDQRNAIVSRLLDLLRFKDRSPDERSLLEIAADKLRQFPMSRLTQAERNAFGLSQVNTGRVHITEESLAATPDQTAVHVDGFFIARFPVTRSQFSSFTSGLPAKDLPSAVEEPEVSVLEDSEGSKPIAGRRAATVRTEQALDLLADLDARLPTAMEWEKAARGEDGRLYPWGDDWDEQLGRFFYGVKYDPPGAGLSVTQFPGGASPYGVLAMAGGLPELVEVTEARPILTRR